MEEIARAVDCSFEKKFYITRMEIKFDEGREDKQV